MTAPGVVIYGEGRCGSALLVSLLDSIDGFRCDGEVLQDRVASPRVLLNDLRRQTCEQVYRCKILRYHPLITTYLKMQRLTLISMLFLIGLAG